MPLTTVGRDMGAQTMANEVIVGSLIVVDLLDEFQQVCNFGTNHSSVGRGDRVWGEISPFHNDNIDRFPEPQECVLELLDPNSPACWASKKLPCVIYIYILCLTSLLDQPGSTVPMKLLTHVVEPARYNNLGL